MLKTLECNNRLRTVLVEGFLLLAFVVTSSNVLLR